MKFSDISVILAPRILRKEHAEAYVGGPANLRALKEAGWVRPVIERSSNTSYDVRDLDLAIDRAKIEGWPLKKG